MNLLEECVRHLEYLGFGTAADEERDGNLFYGRLPEKDGVTVSVMASDAGVPGSGARLEFVVRAENDRDAFEVCDGIARALDGFEGFLMGWGRRVSMRLINGAHGLGADERRRALYACNVRVFYCS